MKASAAPLAVCLIVAACGGGSSTAPIPTPSMKEGLYLGTSLNFFFGAAGLPTSVLVLEQQEVWVLDGRTPPKVFGQGSFEYTGKGTLSNGSSANVFSQAKALTAIESVVLGEKSMELRFGEASSAPVVYVPQSAPIEPLYASLTPSTSFDYSQAARISDVAGFWGASAPNSNSYVGIAPLTVSATGDLSTSQQDSGCSVVGTLKPRPSGKNIFNLSVTLTGCADSGEYAGVAFRYVDTANYAGGSVEVPTYYGVPTLRLIAINKARTRVFNMTTTK